MNLGLVARADDRGIGTMTWEFSRHMQPQRTLVVRELGAESKGFEPHLGRYLNHVDVVTYDGQLDERACRDFLDGLDVVYLAETPYDFRFFEWAREARCATVLHVMPEFWRWHDASVPRPDVWWLPTSWRAELLPDECVVVPVPVPTSPHVAPSSPTMLHVAGHRAAMDRNGTSLLTRSARMASEPIDLRIETQGPQLRVLEGGPAYVEVHTGGRADRWEMYDGMGVLVMPRRYGGLCLPVLEAVACGMAIVMPDVPPNHEWPIVPVRARTGAMLETAAGRLQLYDTDARELARTLDRLHRDPQLLELAQQESRAFAEAHSWRSLEWFYRQQLDAACGVRSAG